MMQVGKVKIRDIKELQASNVTPQNAMTPLRKRKNLKSATSNKKLKEENYDNATVINGAIANTTTATKTTRKRLSKSALKETPSNQKRIDSYFNSCPKSYDIKWPKQEPQAEPGGSKDQSATTKAKGSRCTTTKKKNIKSSKRLKVRRKRLFSDSTEPSIEKMSVSNHLQVRKDQKAIECITIDSDDDGEEKSDVLRTTVHTNIDNEISKPAYCSGVQSNSTAEKFKISSVDSLHGTDSSLSFGQRMTKTSCENTTSTVKSSKVPSTGSRRKTKPCPPYKIIENTTFAVDAFQFGYIENVTHYFLTHFHADHYIGLTKSFSMPLYVSSTTARLLREFIPLQEQYIHELELNQPYIINDIEVTALDANHCPGSILLVFKFLETGKCILHTGDFRANHDMESEPIFWNNHIHTVYLDTTYISDKYAFCTQFESIIKAQDLIEKFRVKHADKRILFICGSYVIGKEKFWSSLAERYEMKVWAEGNRCKALKAINEERLNKLLVEDPNEAHMHVIPMGKLSYLELVEYFKLYEHWYDIVFAIRPSGWEKDTKPRYGPKINLVGIEYSEHSSYAEMQRFVKFLKPEQVISTVPTGRDLMKTAKVPTNWYIYDKLKVTSNYQPSIDSYLGKTPLRKCQIRLPNVNKGGVEYFVSPLKLTTRDKINEINNNINLQQDRAISIMSSQPTESNERVYELSSENKRECLNQNISKNFYKNVTKATHKSNTLAVSKAGSSEDFEKSDFIIKTRISQRNKKNLIEKVKNNSITQAKSKRNKKHSAPKNVNIKVIAANSDELFETPDTKLKKETENANDKVDNVNSSLVSLEDDLYNSNANMQTTPNPDFEVFTLQTRITRSKRASSNSTNVLSKSQTVHCEESLNSKPQLHSTGSKKKSKSISLNSTSTDERHASDKTPEHNLELPFSQKRITRSKTPASTITSVSIGSQNIAEKEFESKLLKLTEQSNQLLNSKRSLKCTKNLNTSKDNPILKSTTNSTADPTSADEMNLQSLKIPEHQIQFPTTSQKWLTEIELPATAGRSKRQTLNTSLNSFKKSKPLLDTQSILKTILEQGEDIDRLNCSQLAGLVVETVNKHNPDFSKDHIPADLLSDADDDWM